MQYYTLIFYHVLISLSANKKIFKKKDQVWTCLEMSLTEMWKKLKIVIKILWEWNIEKELVIVMGLCQKLLTQVVKIFFALVFRLDHLNGL